MNGLIYATRGGSKQPVTIGLAVHNDVVVQGPPYAGRLGLVDRKTGAGVGKSGQSAWRFLTFMGWRCEWLPADPTEWKPCDACASNSHRMCLNSSCSCESCKGTP